MADRLQSHVAGPEPLVLDLEVTQRVPLQGAELEEYLRQATGQGVGAEMAEVAEVEDDDVAGVLQEHIDGQAGDEGDVGPGGAQDGARSAGALAAARSRSLGLGDDEMQGLAPEPEVLLEGFQPPQVSATHTALHARQVPYRSAAPHNSKACDKPCSGACSKRRCVCCARCDALPCCVLLPVSLCAGQQPPHVP